MIGHFGIWAIIGAVIGFVTIDVKNYINDGKLFNGDLSEWEYFVSTLGGVGYGVSKGITSIFADRKIFGVLGHLTDNTKVNKRLAKVKFGHLKIGKQGLNEVYKKMYEAYGYETMRNVISSIYDFAIGISF